MAPKIAILGAGPSGLTLARLLELQNVEYVVFERNESQSSVTQGGSLDIHTNSGQLALKEAGIFDKFQEFARYDAISFKILDQHGKVQMVWGKDPDVPESDRPEIDRTALRSILLDSIPKERVQWDRAVKSVNKGAEGSMSVSFADGSTASGFELVVGADGGWSKARSLVTSAKPLYSGIQYLETCVTPSNPFHSTVSSIAGPGTMMATGSRKTIAAQSNGDGSYKIYLGLFVPEDFTKSGAINLADGPATRKTFLERDEYFANWAPELQDIIRHSEGSFRAWPLYYMPPDALSWESVPGVTLIGDAAHVSTPFQGEGVNCSMHDSLQLARKIKEHGVENLPLAVSEYEKLMFPRGIDLITRSGDGGKMLMAEDAPKPMLEAFAARMAAVGNKDGQ